MKKFFSMLSVVMAMASVSFVSCSNDDDVIKTIDPQEAPQATRAFSSVKAQYSCQLAESTLKGVKVVASYTDEEGKTVNETISDLKWEKAVTINKPVAACDFKIFISKVGDTDEDVRIEFEKIDVSVTSYDQNGNVLSSLDKPSGYRLTTPNQDQLEEFFAVYAEKPYYAVAADFNKEGKISY